MRRRKIEGTLSEGEEEKEDNTYLELGDSIYSDNFQRKCENCIYGVHKPETRVSIFLCRTICDRGSSCETRGSLFCCHVFCCHAFVCRVADDRRIFLCVFFLGQTSDMPVPNKQINFDSCYSFSSSIWLISWESRTILFVMFIFQVTPFGEKHCVTKSVHNSWQGSIGSPLLLHGAALNFPATKTQVSFAYAVLHVDVSLIFPSITDSV